MGRIGVMLYDSQPHNLLRIVSLKRTHRLAVAATAAGRFARTRIVRRAVFFVLAFVFLGRGGSSTGAAHFGGYGRRTARSRAGHHCRPLAPAVRIVGQQGPALVLASAGIGGAGGVGAGATVAAGHCPSAASAVRLDVRQLGVDLLQGLVRAAILASCLDAGYD